MNAPEILIMNASLGHEGGNTIELLRRAKKKLGAKAKINMVSLSASVGFIEVEPMIRRADAFIFGTGTYWDSWSHHLQRFLEEATPSEGTSLWLGKPAGVVVMMHSVGGKGVLSRLQGVLSTFGCVIPPMSGMVYSLVNQAALRTKGKQSVDVWSPADVDVVCHNVLAALQARPRYRAWKVDRDDPATKWINAAL